MTAVTIFCRSKVAVALQTSAVSKKINKLFCFKFYPGDHRNKFYIFFIHFGFLYTVTPAKTSLLQTGKSNSFPSNTWTAAEKASFHDSSGTNV